MSESANLSRGRDVPRRLTLKQTVFGVPVCTALRSHLDQSDLHRPLLIRDLSATEANGITWELENSLSTRSPCMAINVGSPLSPSEVDELGEFCSAGGFDCIVAVGGGASMDAAKLIALHCSNEMPARDLIAGNFRPNQLPIVAAPTTAGSGSEATHFAVLFVGEDKHSVAHPSLKPELAIVDPSLIATAPRRVAVAAGLDVLCQSIESLWSRQADHKSRAYASEALRLVVPNLLPAIVDGDANAQAHLCMASHLAGHAINRSFTTSCHALSYMLTSRHGITHGIAAAATLPSMLLFNAQRVVPSSVQHQTTGNMNVTGDMNGCLDELSGVFGCHATDVEKIVRQLVLLIRSIQGAASISELNLPADYCPQEHAEILNPERLRNNPRYATSADIVRVLQMTFDSHGNAMA